MLQSIEKLKAKNLLKYGWKNVRNHFSFSSEVLSCNKSALFNVSLASTDR